MRKLFPAAVCLMMSYPLSHDDNESSLLHNIPELLIPNPNPVMAHLHACYTACTAHLSLPLIMHPRLHSCHRGSCHLTLATVGCPFFCQFSIMISSKPSYMSS